MREQPRSPIKILEDLLFALLPGNYSPYGQSVTWKVSKDFYDLDFSDFEQLEREFAQEFAVIVAGVEEIWGKPDFRSHAGNQKQPSWFWISVLHFCYWQRDEGIAYIALHREDQELPFEITLGAVTEEGVEEMSDFR